MNKSAKVLLDHSVQDLGLSIRLRVICRAEPELRATQMKKLLPKPTEK